MQTQNEEALPSNRGPRLPVGLIVVASAMLVGLAFWHARIDRAAAIAYSGEVGRAAAISGDAARILHLDEALTMSARMAAATGDEAWIRRYEQFAPELDGLIKEAAALVPPAEGGAGLSRLDRANQSLVGMEQASFALVRQGKREAARALLSGPEYARWKQEYGAEVAALLHAVAVERQRESARAQRRLLLSHTAAGAATVSVLGLWFLILWLGASAWRANATRYQAAAESLRENEARYRIIFESSRDAIMTLAPPSWRFTSGNQATVEMFGLKNAAELVSLGPWDLSPEMQPNGVPSSAQAQEMIGAAMREGYSFFEWVHKRVTGEVFPATVLLTRMELTGQTLLQATVRDITAQRQAEEATKLEAARADAANAAKSDFLANMSHEIRTPMTAILGFAEVVGDSIGRCAACPDHQSCAVRVQHREATQIIRRNGEHLLTLINDILDLSKIESNKLQVEREACSPVQLVEEVVSLMRVHAVEKGLSLVTRYEFPLPETILSDPTRVRQILTNLVGNAVKFTLRGQVEIVVRCSLGGQTGEATLSFVVEDTGIGLAPEEVARLFQPFVQKDTSTTRQYGGTGLGLSISRRLARALGGDITVESRPGAGSSFTFALKTDLPQPIRLLEDLSEAAFRASHRPLASPSAPKLRGRVLLAEDGEDNQKLISTILRAAGADVEVAENGRLAVERALSARSAGTPYGAILMDMQMPEMDGYEATRQLRRLGYGGPIIALTAHAMADDRGKCLGAGCDDYATKPIDRRDLLSTLARLMEAPAMGQKEADRAGPARPLSKETLRSQFAADPDMAEVIVGFVGRLPDTLAAMLAAMEGSSHEELQRLAHQLKGAGGGFGYPALTNQARRLEEAARAADEKVERRAFEDLRELVQAIIGGQETVAVLGSEGG